MNNDIEWLGRGGAGKNGAWEANSKTTNPGLSSFQYKYIKKDITKIYNYLPDKWRQRARTLSRSLKAFWTSADRWGSLSTCTNTDPA